MPVTAGTAGWHAVAGDGCDPATGHPPDGPGAPSPAAALARVPVAAWPVRAEGHGGVLAVGDALGAGGGRVEQLLDRVAAGSAPPARLPVADLAGATPAGRVELPVALVDRTAGVGAAAAVDRAWMATVEARRAVPRVVLAGRGREVELDAALNLAMLVGTDGLAATKDVDDGDEGPRMASGARLWLLGGAVAWALLDDPDDPFAAWADLVSYGLWPVGPVGSRLVICSP